MSRDYRLYLDDILEAIKQIRSYVEGQDEKSFANDRKTQDAVVRNLEIIGEATKSLPDSLFGTDALKKALAAIRGNYVASDRLADAFAAVWSAWRILQGTADKFPEEQILDGKGLPMRIWA